MSSRSREGKLEAIWIKRARGRPMDPVEKGQAVQGWGLFGNANQGGQRQVTVIEREVFERLSRELKAEIDPAWRRANLMVSGIRLTESRGRTLRIGELELEIRGETRPCEQMDAAFPGLRKALQPGWGGGAYGIVLNDASIQVGDPVAWTNE